MSKILAKWYNLYEPKKYEKTLFFSRVHSVDSTLLYKIWLTKWFFQTTSFISF